MINDYAKFVDMTTSPQSKDHLAFEKQWNWMMGSGSQQGVGTPIEWTINMPRLLTSVVGMMAESGEFAEVVKKKLFQSEKQFDDDEIFHLKRELGDVLWYWVQGCIALGFKPEDVMQENIRKLEKRYPNGFKTIRSEVRQDGDI